MSMTWLRAGCPTSCRVQASSEMACAMINTFPPEIGNNITMGDHTLLVVSLKLHEL